MDINHLIAHRLRELRDAQGFSLAALAERSGVSKSNISLIERGESSATATVLDKLSAALGVTVASLFEKPAEDAPSPVSRAKDQPVWTDPGSGYVRRNLSPGAGLAKSSPIQLVEISFPAGQRVAYETTTREVDVHQQVWVIEGTMEVTVGESHWTLDAGDCLAMGSTSRSLITTLQPSRRATSSRWSRKRTRRRGERHDGSLHRAPPARR